MKFTTEKPTVPGAYWWRSTAISNSPGVHHLVEIYKCSGRLFAWRDGGMYTANVWPAWVGEWSSRLVPSDEYVKKEDVKKAFYEGKGRQSTIEAGVKISAYEGSRARRVVEGRDVE